MWNLPKRLETEGFMHLWQPNRDGAISSYMVESLYGYRYTWFELELKPRRGLWWERVQSLERFVTQEDTKAPSLSRMLELTVLHIIASLESETVYVISRCYMARPSSDTTNPTSFFFPFLCSFVFHIIQSLNGFPHKAILITFPLFSQFISNTNTNNI